MKKLAIVDMGTNTFHLLIAYKRGKKFIPLLKERRAVKLGENGINKAWINEDAEKRALDALSEFSKIIHNQEPEELIATATSAMRSAKNGQDLLSKIKDKIGIHVNIISGDQEAVYIYEGVKKAVVLGKQPVLIMDIGGGSVEFIIANKHEIFWKISYDIGAQRLLEEFQKNEPITPQERKALYHYLDTETQELQEQIKKYKPKVLIGSSGTFDTIADIYFQQIGKHRPSKTRVKIPLENTLSICEDICTKNKADRLNIPGMSEMRVDMIVVACCLILHVFNANDELDKLHVSSYALKEGVLHYHWGDDD